MEDEFFTNNMVIYIEKEIAENFSFEGTKDNLLDICDFLYSYNYTKLCIYFYCISDSN